ncbi:MAG: glycosyltransferase [Chloroflexi bacterium]|nr:glycosyltransferase [Chloroflexota bacterium]
MRIVMFYHSLVSDWNHGNAHLLRGIVRELQARGHRVDVYEPRDGWSLRHLVAAHGQRPLREFRRAFPTLRSTAYDEETLDLRRALAGADLVIVHEWNSPRLVHRIGAHHRRAGGYGLLFHDTHHRSVTAPQQMADYDLSGYDGVLAFGRVVRDLYLAQRWARRAWTWHEAADVRLFRPLPCIEREGDVVWIGNWGDDERTRELNEYLFEPVRALGLRARVHGVRYPPEALRALRESGIEYTGWLPNYRVPHVLARFALTVHVPRRPYVERLPGIPTIRVFEALACGIPLVSAPWRDAEGLFRPGTDYLVARDGREMQEHLAHLLADRPAAEALARAGRETILARHTCAHRVDELLATCGELGLDAAAPPIPADAAVNQVAEEAADG